MLPDLSPADVASRLGRAMHAVGVHGRLLWSDLRAGALAAKPAEADGQSGLTAVPDWGDGEYPTEEYVRWVYREGNGEPSDPFQREVLHALDQLRCRYGRAGDQASAERVFDLMDRIGGFCSEESRIAI